MNSQEILRELQSLDAQNPGAWPTWARNGAVILVSVLLVLLGLYFVIQPQYNELEEERGKEVGLREEFERKQKKVAALDAYKDQLAEMERSFGAMLRQMRHQ